MKDREFENYLALLSGMLRLRRTQREGIAGELRDHLVEHVAHLEASGIAHEEAVRRALEEFGDAAALAANFSALVGMRRRRLIMRCTIGTTVVMTGLVVAMLAFRPPVMDDPSIVKAQAGGSDSKAAKGKEASQPTERIAGSDSEARNWLQSNKISADFVDLPVRDALAFISDKVGVQCYIDKESLAGGNATPDTPVTFSLKNVPAEMLLDLVLRQANLGYRLRNGVVMVASAADVQSQTEVRVYRVREGMAEELAALIPDTIDAHLWSGHTVITDPRGRRRAGYGSMEARGGYGGGGGYGSRGGYGGVGPAEGEHAEAVGGGGAGTIRVFRGTLVISQTPEVHERIEKLLDDLAGAGAMDPQKRSDSTAADRTGMTPAPQPQSPFSGQPGYGQGGGRGQTGYGPNGYGTTGRSGHGETGYGPPGRGGYGAAAGGSRGGYGSGDAGYGGAGHRRTGAGDQPGRGAASDAAPAGGSPSGQPPSSGGLTPVPQDPNGPSDAPLGPSAPGGQPPGATDPNAAEPDSA
jgi:hypothetical protein